MCECNKSMNGSNDYSLLTANTGIVTISVANPNLNGTGTLVTLITGAENGTIVKSVIVKAAMPVTTGMVRLFVGPDGTYPDFNDENRVHGFQKSSGVWQTTSPTYAADGIYGQKIVSQTKAAGALTYVNQAPYDRIYYRDIFGYLSYALTY